MNEDYEDYRWIITKDRIGGDDKGVESGNLDPSIKVNAARFSMYDDDGECYYEGMIYGEYDGFEPLDDFGMPNAGCTGIKVNGEWV